MRRSTRGKYLPPLVAGRRPASARTSRAGRLLRSGVSGRDGRARPEVRRTSLERKSDRALPTIPLPYRLRYLPRACERPRTAVLAPKLHIGLCRANVLPPASCQLTLRARAVSLADRPAENVCRSRSSTGSPPVALATVLSLVVELKIATSSSGASPGRHRRSAPLQIQ